MDKYQSKYNKIVMDNQENSPNSNIVVRLTLEQYYDLLHHTHKISDIIECDIHRNKYRTKSYMLCETRSMDRRTPCLLTI